MSEPVSIEIDSAPKLIPPVSKVAEKVEISTSLVIKAPQDNAHHGAISPQTHIPIMDLRLRILANIRVSLFEVMYWFDKVIINYLVPVSAFPGDMRGSIDVCAASHKDMVLDEGNGDCSGNVRVYLPGK